MQVINFFAFHSEDYSKKLMVDLAAPVRLFHPPYPVSFSIKVFHAGFRWVDSAWPRSAPFFFRSFYADQKPPPSLILSATHFTAKQPVWVSP